MATGTSSLYKGSDELVLECDVCKYQGLTSQAVSYCKICTEALCQACDKVHRASRQTRDHKLLTGDQLLTIPTDFTPIPSVMTCDKHQLPIIYFCKTDNGVFCNTCKIAYHRQCDTTEIITHATKNKLSQEFSRVHDQLTELEQAYRELQQERASGKVKLKTHTQNCFEELAIVRKKLNDVLDDIETKMKAEIKNIEETKTKELNGDLDIVNDTLRQIRENFKLMKECKSTRQNEIMFVAMKTVECLLQEYEHVKFNMVRKGEDIAFHLKINEYVTAHLRQLHSLIQLARPMTFLELAVSDGKFYNMDCTSVQSIVFLPNDHVVLACFVNGLKLLDKNFQLISELPMRAIKTCKVSETEVLVTLGKQANVQFVDVLPTLVKKDPLNIGRGCTGVDFYNNKIFVTCHDNPGNGEVRILDRNGQLQRRLGFDGESYMFTRPVDVKVTRNGDKVIIADEGEDCIICLDQQGQVIYRYTDMDLKDPVGFLLDTYDNLLICGFSSNNVHVVSKNGRKLQIILAENDGITNPRCISYRHSDECIVVGLDSDDESSLCTFNTNP